MRMENCSKANPNLAHQIIFEFEEKYNVQIVTQNIDNFHERAGSTNVLIMEKRESIVVVLINYPIRGGISKHR